MTIKDIFQLELSNRFNALYWEDQEQDIESEWTAGRDIIKNACKEVLRKKTNKKKEWMSDTTWQKVEERRKMKEKVKAKTREQKNDAHTIHQNLDKEIKTLCRNNKREYVNQLATEAERAAYMGDKKNSL